jgi:N4-gp56 family major capsid protein
MAVGRKADYTAHIPALWARDLFSEAEFLTFWHKFEGPEGSGMPIIRRDDLTKQAGDTIKLDIVLALTGAGSTGDTTLTEGNEEKMKLRQMSVVVDMQKHAVRWSDLAAALISHDMRVTAKNQLAKWLAGKLDGAVFTEMTGASVPAQNKWYSGTATSRDTIADTDAGGRLKLTTLSEIKAFARTELKIEPLRMENGEEIFGLVLHPYTVMSLKNDTSYQQAQRDAGVRGRENPLFSGAIAMWDGVVMFESGRVPRSNNANSPVVSTSDNIFFGSQALARAFARYPQWREQEFSYGEEIGIQTNVIKGEELLVFDLSAAGDASDNTAIGSMVLYASAVAPVA